MEPVRVKVYGLFSRTRRRYLVEALTGAVLGLILFLAWWLGWPTLRQRLTTLRSSVPVAMGRRDTRPRPWILLGAALWKGMEVLFVLRSFARKEASNRIKETASLN